jgi:hypothetical protein
MADGLLTERMYNRAFAIQQMFTCNIPRTSAKTITVIVPITDLEGSRGLRHALSLRDLFRSRHIMRLLLVLGYRSGSKTSETNLGCKRQYRLVALILHAPLRQVAVAPSRFCLALGCAP